MMVIVAAVAVLASPAFAQNGDPQELKVKDVLELAADWQIGLLIVASVIVILILWLGDIIRPGSLVKAGLRQVDPYLSLVWMFAAVLVFLSTAFAYQFVTNQSWITGGAADGTLRYEASVLLATSVIASGIAMGMAYLISRSAPGSGLKVRWIDISLGLLAFVLAMPIVLLTGVLSKLVYLQMEGAEPDPIAHPTLELITQNYGDQWAWVMIVSVVVLVPIIEEIIYRGFLQSAVLRYTKSPWTAVLLTSVAFTAAHVNWSNPADGVPYYALAPLFVLSVTMGLAFERTRHIGVPMIMHAAFNAMNVALAVSETQPVQ